MEWWVYSHQVGRFGVDRDDIHYGYMAAAAAGGRPTDFMPYFDQFAADVTAADLVAPVTGKFAKLVEEG